MLIKILSKLWWLGFIGLIGLIIDNPVLTPFCLFWLLGFIHVFSPLRGVIGSVVFLFQNLAMLFAMPIIPFLYRFRLPNKDNYTPECSYSLPFEGTWLTVNGGIDEQTSHSWFLVNQRYAYDFIVTNEDCISYEGDRKNLDNYHCYAKNILAPADGVVVYVKSKFQDTPIGGIAEALCASSSVYGNHIIIKHGKHEHSVICHLLKDSITVKAGDGVIRGQIIAQCGNSGNTSEPHIHFQIQDGKSMLFSAGLPVFFDSKKIEVVGEKKEVTHIQREQFVKNKE